MEGDGNKVLARRIASKNKKENVNTLQKASRLKESTRPRMNEGRKFFEGDKMKETLRKNWLVMPGKGITIRKRGKKKRRRTASEIHKKGKMELSYWGEEFNFVGTEEKVTLS